MGSRRSTCFFRTKGGLIRSSALPQRHIVPAATGDLGRAGLLPPLQGGLGFLPGEMEPIPPNPDASARIGEPDGVQGAATAPNLGLPDPAAGFHQVYGLPRSYALFWRQLLHTPSVPAAVAPGK